jgi:hypothetical protein
MGTATETALDALSTRTPTMLEAVLAVVQLYLGPDMQVTTFIRDGEEWVFRFATRPASVPCPTEPRRASSPRTGHGESASRDVGGADLP